MGWLKDIFKEAESSVSTFIDDPMSAINPATALPGLGTTLVRGASIALGISPDKGMRRLGFNIKGPSLNDQLAEVNNRERDNSLRDALADRSIDDISRDQLVNMFDAGARTDELSAHIKNAREGKGIFGVRKVNQAQKNQVADMPGRRQLLAVKRNV